MSVSGNVLNAYDAMGIPIIGGQDVRSNSVWYKTYIDQSIATTTTYDVYTDLGDRPVNKGNIINDSTTTTISYQVSVDGTNYGDTFKLKPGEIRSFANWIVWKKLKVTASPTAATIAGDTASQLSALSITGVTTSNSNAFVLYWNLTNATSTRTVQVYKDSAKTQLVLQGSRTGDGSITLAEENSSGLSGSVTVAYTQNDTDAGNTFTFPAYTFRMDFV